LAITGGVPRESSVTSNDSSGGQRVDLWPSHIEVILNRTGVPWRRKKRKKREKEKKKTKKKVQKLKKKKRKKNIGE